ncbi:hypothetical protein D3C72_1938660 [compost metagenome]
MVARLPFIWASAASNCPVSSRDVAAIRLDRSPRATVVATCSASFSGRVIERVIQVPISAANSVARAPRPIISMRLVS